MRLLLVLVLAGCSLGPEVIECPFYLSETGDTVPVLPADSIVEVPEVCEDFWRKI